MGSAAVAHLARHGQRVLGLDQFTPPHERGSSHGQTRIIREAYFEHPSYVPLLRRAYELWNELQREANTPLLKITGGLMIGTPDSTIVQGALRSAQEHQLPHELLPAQEIRTRFPALQPPDEMTGVFEPRAGILYPEACIAAHLAAAQRSGAELLCDQPVLNWTSTPTGVRVNTATGSWHAQQLIITAGAWISRLVPELARHFRVERQVLHWFEPRSTSAVFSPRCCPIHLWQFDGQHFFYGFPYLEGGVKVARHHDGQAADPDTVNRTVAASEVDDMRAIVQRFLPDAAGPIRQSTVCLYTNTPDEHFWIDRHPAHPNVLIASPCSGHGFKFASVIGEVLADLATIGTSRFDLSLFRTP